MAYSLTWLATVLKDAGLKVATVDGWENRGSGDVGEIRGVLCHHTAGPQQGQTNRHPIFFAPTAHPIRNVPPGTP